MSRLQWYLVIGAILLAGIASIPFLSGKPSPTSTSWTGSGGLFSFGERAPLGSEPQNAVPTERKELGIVPLPPPTAPESGDLATNLTELLAQLAQPARHTNTSDADPTIPSAYAFIPSGFISALSPQRTRTPEQEELHGYGNTMGMLLTAFADAHPNMPETLRNHAEDRSNSLKIGMVKRLAADFAALGEEIAAIDAVPLPAQGAHRALAAAYRDAGAKLAIIPDSTSDQTFLDAINAYNTSAQELSRSLVNMIDLFVARDVTFTASDAGSIFTFSANASL